MQIAICVTKNTKSGSNPAYQAIESGLLAHGDTIKWITKETEFRRIEGCDALFQIGEFSHNRLHRNRSFRWKLAHWAHTKKIRRVVIDTGYIHNCKSRTCNTHYYSVGFDGIKGFGSYYNENSPSDRFDKLHIDIKPWKTEQKGDVLLATINDQGWASGFYDDNSWMKKVILYILEKTDHRLLIKPHPNAAKRFLNSDICNNMLKQYGRSRIFIYPQQKLRISALLNNSFVCVASGSNSTVDALLHGIPIICPLDFNIAYDMGVHSVTKMDKLYYPDNRQQFFNNLAYTQWNFAEIASGETWAYLKQFINHPPSTTLHMIDYVKTHDHQFKLQK